MINNDENKIALLRRNVDLNSYSFSPGFLGYFEKKGAFDEAKCFAAIESFFKFLDFLQDETTMISSLHIENDLMKVQREYDISDNHINEYLKPLINSGVIETVDFDAFQGDPNSSEYSDKLECLWLRFREFASGDKFFLERAMFSVMGIGGTRGHLFFLLDSIKIIAYPHDDIGFGFVNCSDNPKDKMQCLLKTEFSSKEFDDNFKWHFVR